jgi:hypothetical protein
VGGVGENRRPRGGKGAPWVFGGGGGGRGEWRCSKVSDPILLCREGHFVLNFMSEVLFVISLCFAESPVFSPTGGQSRIK